MNAGLDIHIRPEGEPLTTLSNLLHKYMLEQLSDPEPKETGSAYLVLAVSQQTALAFTGLRRSFDLAAIVC